MVFPHGALAFSPERPFFFASLSLNFWELVRTGGSLPPHANLRQAGTCRACSSLEEDICLTSRELLNTQ